MPIIERDPWRQEYFSGIPCPQHIVISTDDRDSVDLYPKFRWIYNKITICQTQGIPCAPHNIKPTSYPVFSKPIINLRGMGIESYKLNNEEDYHTYCKPGHFWMQFLAGEHISTDVALIDGQVVWQSHVQGISAGQGTFDYWHILADAKPALERYCQKWLQRHLSNYTGMVNLESIGGTIIEVHLRMVDQWPDLYGDGWIESVIGLHEHHIWKYPSRLTQEAFSVVLFGTEIKAYKHPPSSLIDEIKKRPSISSVQITFHESIHPESHARPPGGFRLAIVNCYDLKAGRQACADLADFFGVHYAL